VARRLDPAPPALYKTIVMPSDCVFCAIAAGEAPAAVVFRNVDSCAFLDRRPVFKGHVLLVPMPHVRDLTDLPAERVGPLFTKARRLARALEKGLGAEGTLVLANNKVSQSVPHLHVHVIPRRRGDGLRGFLWPRHAYDSDAESSETAARIAAALDA
jgi:histidine triad (HIT) family protein